jgi:polyisoprenoid-binding protein YceI
MRTLAASAALALLVGGASLAQEVDGFGVSTAPIPAGDYTLDRAHASLIFRVSHLGFSNYTARFTRFDAQLTFDPENPEAASVTATIDPSSLETDFPNPELVDFNAQITGPGWLEAEQFPEMTYRSTSVTVTGENTARIDGELTLHGVRQPVSLETTYNGGYAGLPPYDPAARIGFSARGTLSRSAFGVDDGVPAPGSNVGVFDPVEVIIEAEFTGPPLAAE